MNDLKDFPHVTIYSTANGGWLVVVGDHSIYAFNDWASVIRFVAKEIGREAE